VVEATVNVNCNDRRRDERIAHSSFAVENTIAKLELWTRERHMI
jgi:hypothetical protein